MSEKEHYDILVIGSGEAGKHLTLRACPQERDPQRKGGARLTGGT